MDKQLFKEKLQKRCKQLNITQKQAAEKAGISNNTLNAWIGKGKQDEVTGTYREVIPSIDKVKKLADALEVSVDYFINPDMDCLTITKQQISDYTGLSDAAIDGLKCLKKSDNNCIRNLQPGLCVLPLLNDMLGTYQGMEFERLLRAIGDYMNADYCVPVYHVEKESDKYGTVAETIKSSSNLDIIEGTTITFIDHDKETTATFPRQYIQHFAKENDIDDNIPVVVDKQFIQAVALSRIQQSLSLLQQDIESNKSNTK